MNTNKIIFTKVLLLFASIGFLTYILIILASFLGCCTGITRNGFHILLIVLSTASMITFAVCVYNNCYKGTKDMKPGRK